MMFRIWLVTVLIFQSYFLAGQDLLTDSLKRDYNNKAIADKKKAILSLVSTLVRRNDNEAKIYIDEALKLHKDHAVNRLDLLLELTVFYGKQAQYDSVTAISINRTLPLAKVLKDSTRTSSILSNLGQVAMSQGDYDKAIDFYYKARKTAKPSRLVAYDERIAVLYTHLEQYDSAQIYYQKVIRLCQRDNLTDRSCTIALIGMGVNYEKVGQLGPARKYMQLALEQAQKDKYTLCEGYCYNNLGWYEIKDSNYTEVLPLLNESLKIAMSKKAENLIAYTTCNIAACHQEIGNLSLAKSNYINAINRLVKLKDIEILKKAYYGLHLTYEKAKDYQNALKWHRKYKEISDTLTVSRLEGINKLREKNILLQAELKQQKLELEKQDEAAKAEQRLLLFFVALAFVALFYHMYLKNKKNATTIKLLNQELKHRVKNNLQNLISIVGKEHVKLRINPITSPTTILLSIESYMQSMVALYEIIEYKDEKQVNVKVFFEKVRKHYQAMAKHIVPGLSIKIKAVDTYYNREKLSYLVQLLIELMSNSCKHAFGNVESPNIHIEFSLSKKTTFIHVKDNGIGFMDDEPKQTEGLAITENLVKLLNGKIQMVSSSNGTLYTIEIPNKSMLS